MSPTGIRGQSLNGVSPQATLSYQPIGYMLKFTLPKDYFLRSSPWGTKLLVTMTEAASTKLSPVGICDTTLEITH